MAEQRKRVTIDTPARELARRNAIVRAVALPAARIPSATYRLQFNPAFTFDDARRIVPYLHELGISDCYASPCLKASRGSTHGYDVTDHSALNPALGGATAFDRLVGVLRRHRMGQMLDVIPNHMGIGSANPAWISVLENGPSSPHARLFDIDWHPLTTPETLENRVLLPILGDSYGKTLENQEIQLTYEEGRFAVCYYDHALPIDPSTEIELLSFALDKLIARVSAADEHVIEIQSIIYALSHLPTRTEIAPERIAERQREKELIRRRLDAVVQSSVELRKAIDETVSTYNGRKGGAESFDRLDALLGAQAYRLAYWRVAAEEINYRRFFDVNDLAAIRMEDPQVFQETHRLILQLVEDGKVTGLRIDHPDGLMDPAGYFSQLQRSAALRLSRAGWKKNHGHMTGDGREEEWQDWVGRQGKRDGANPMPIYVVAEKILSSGERLREDWPVHGTTGYEFLNALNGLFVARNKRLAFDSVYSSFTGGRMKFANLVNSSKKLIMLVSLVSEVNMLGYQLKRISAKNRWYRDFTLNSLTFALREVIACLPVYRTYVVAGAPSLDRQDRMQIEAAIAEAKHRNPRTAAQVFDFIHDILVERFPARVSEEEQAERTTFVMKFQQTTGPIMAKGVEDTAFYMYNRLVSLNEVGGNPEQFGITVAAFHRKNAERQRRWPHSLLATSTHDTKRSEDVRARIDVLSEMPGIWRDALWRWSRINRGKKRLLDGVTAPDANEEYLLYQTLLGAWPLEPMDEDGREVFRSRIEEYMVKAVREAKVNTSWINPNVLHDEAVVAFVRAILKDDQEDGFLRDFASVQELVAEYGIYNSLAQVLLKIGSPGVPDFYQGNEIWDFSLVDPDNRRPVDFARRARLLRGLRRQLELAGEDRRALVASLVDSKEDGRIKLLVTHVGLSFRRDHGDIFRLGSYHALAAKGAKRDNVVAFARQYRREAAVVVVPRLIYSLTGGTPTKPTGAQVWADSWLPLPEASLGRRFRNVFTGELLEPGRGHSGTILPLAEVFASFPVALLERVG